MSCLLDTHSFLWFITSNLSLSVSAKATIENTREVFLSVASLWEISIKYSNGRLELPAPFMEFLVGQMERNAMVLLPIKPDHIALLPTLSNYHRDPFDRIIATQAIYEQVPIVTKDKAFEGYGIATLW